MPHVVLNGDVNLDDIFNKFKSILIRNQHGILKTDNIYINRDTTSILIESLVIEKDVKNSFLAMISRRDDGVVVRIYPGIEVEKTSSVKKLLSLIAKQLIETYSGLQIGETNLSDYLK